MANILLQDFDPDVFRADILRDFVEAMREVLDEEAEPRLVDGDRLAQLLETSRPTIDRLVRDDLIPSIKIGRLRRFEVRKVFDALEGVSNSVAQSRLCNSEVVE